MQATSWKKSKVFPLLLSAIIMLIAIFWPREPQLLAHAQRIASARNWGNDYHWMSGHEAFLHVP